MNIDLIKLFSENELEYTGSFAQFPVDSQSESYSVVLETILKSKAPSTKLVRLDSTKKIFYYSISPFEKLHSLSELSDENKIDLLLELNSSFNSLIERLVSSNAVYPLAIGEYYIEEINSSYIPHLSTRSYNMNGIRLTKINRVENLLRIFYSN